MGDVVFDESLAIDDVGVSVERHSNSSGEAFRKLFDLAITVAILALFVVVYGAIAYGIYCAWVALS